MKTETFLRDVLDSLQRSSALTFSSVSIKANVHLAKVKLDPEWFLLVLQGVFMTPPLPSLTFPCSFAVPAAT